MSMRSILIECEKCKKRGEIKVPDNLHYINNNGMVSVLVNREICEHDIVLFVDRDFSVRGQTKIDYKLGDRIGKSKFVEGLENLVKKVKFWYRFHIWSSWEIAVWKVGSAVRKAKKWVGMKVYRFGMHVPEEQSNTVRTLRKLAERMSDRMERSVGSARADIRNDIREYFRTANRIISALVDLGKMENEVPEPKPVPMVYGVMPPTEEIMEEVRAHREEMKNLLRMYKVGMSHSR